MSEAVSLAAVAETLPGFETGKIAVLEKLYSRVPTNIARLIRDFVGQLSIESILSSKIKQNSDLTNFIGNMDQINQGIDEDNCSLLSMASNFLYSIAEPQFILIRNAGLGCNYFPGEFESNDPKEQIKQMDKENKQEELYIKYLLMRICKKILPDAQDNDEFMKRVVEETYGWYERDLQKALNPEKMDVVPRLR